VLDARLTEAQIRLKQISLEAHSEALAAAKKISAMTGLPPVSIKTRSQQHS